MRLIAKSALKQYGFTVHDFSNPKEALEHFQANKGRCHLVITDIRLPGMTGFELARELRLIRSDVPIILITAFEINQSEVDLVLPSLRVNAFLKKPFKIATLLTLVKGLANGK